MKIKILFITVFFVVLFSCSESPEIYTPILTPDDAQNLEIAEKFISAGKYLSAFNALGEENSSEAIIEKKVEICLDRNVGTVLNQKFALVDLEEGESLEEKRQEPFKREYIEFNPVEVIAGYEEANGKSLLLQKVLALYYVDVLMGFPGNWVLPDSEVVALALNAFNYSEKNNCYDAFSLGQHAQLLLYTGNYEAAAEKYRESLKLEPEDPFAWYSYAVALLSFGDYKEAGKAAEKSALYFEGNPRSQADATLLAVEALESSGNLKAAEKRLLESDKKNPGYLYNYLSLCELYLKQENITEAEKYAVLLLHRAPHDVRTMQNISQTYIIQGKIPELNNLIVKLLEEFSTDSWAKGYIYLFQSEAFLYTGGKMDEAEKALDNAQASLEEAGKYDEIIRHYIENKREIFK